MAAFPRRCVNLLALLALFWIHVGGLEAAVPSSPGAAITHAEQLLSSLTDTAPTSRYAQVSRELGQVVDGTGRWPGMT